MKGRQIVIDRRPDGATAAALLIDGRLEDLLIDPAEDDPAPRPGAIYRAVTARPMKGMGGVIVDLGDGARGFLRGMKLPPQGKALLVQVSTWADPGKASPVSARPVLRGAFAILTPGAPGLNVSRAVPEGPGRDHLMALAARAMVTSDADVGLILRSMSAEAAPDMVSAEIAALISGWKAIVSVAGPATLARPAPDAEDVARTDWRAHPDEILDDAPDAFEHAGVWDRIDELSGAQIPLSAGSLFVEATRALVAVDVNTGGDLSPAAALKANLAAVQELPRQLRLRGLGGQITIDFAPLAKRDRPRIEATLRTALRGDEVETTVAGWTPLGCLELLRKRIRRPLILREGPWSSVSSS